MATWRLVEDPCPATHPGTGGMCQLEGYDHDEHVYTEWADGEIVGPVYWTEADRG